MKSTNIDKIKALVADRLLVLDGAMGTMIQQKCLSEDDFRGERFATHPQKLAGCNDLLTLTRPDIIRDIHTAYVEAGADILSTNSFNANAISLADYQLNQDRELIKEINRTAAQLARKAADACTTRQILVAGSAGPTNRTASMSPDVSDPALRTVDYDQLADAYQVQAEGLIEGGADLILFETAFDTLNLKAAIYGANVAMLKLGKNLPIMVSATISDKAGRTLSGQTIKAFVDSVAGFDNVFSIGLNCSFGPADIIPFVRELAAYSHLPVSCHPNAGLPNALGEYDESPQSFTGHCRKILDKNLVNIIGGCCGTTPDHIKELAKAAKMAYPNRPQEKPLYLRVAGLESLEVCPQNNFVNVGERCNVAGSRKFLRLINEKKYDEALAIAATQVEDGAMLIDINLDDPLLDAQKEMQHFLRLLASDPDIAKVPLMIDTSNWDVAQIALKNTQGKSILNSISLKEGEEIFIKKATKIKELGAAVIVMAFDEKGQADTFERKIEVCRRAYDILTEKCGFNPTDIIFDVNIMAVATGIEAHSRYGIDFIDAVRWIKQHLPGALTSGGVSNLSFAFRGKNKLREAMHAVFLYHAIKAGLDMAIVNPAAAVTYNDIEPELRTLIEDVVLYRDPEASDRLAAYAAETDEKSENQKTTAIPELSSPHMRLKNALLKGQYTTLISDLNQLLEEGVKPVDIIEGTLMEGMDKVGTLFGEGKMFLPQVVKAARVMKEAVDFLRPFMESGTDCSASAGKVIFATVKGDVHDIGKNIVAIVMACNNYEVIDLGVMVAPEKIVETALREKPCLICLSGLITPSLAEMANTVEALKKAGIDIPVMVGGAATSELHTALKIAPRYDGPVIHVADASQNPLIAAKLFNLETALKFLGELESKQAELVENYFLAKSPLNSLEKARKDAFSPAISKVKVPPFLNKAISVPVNLEEVLGLINWRMFFHAWRFKGSLIGGFPYGSSPEESEKWLVTVDAEQRTKAKEALKLYRDACKMLDFIKGSSKYDGKASVSFHEAWSEDDNLVVKDTEDRNISFPMLRQQRYEKESLCVADFVAKKGKDFVGAFAVTAGNWIASQIRKFKQDGDEFSSLLLQTLADRIAEATSVWLHAKVRNELWAYTEPDNPFGIRPAIGYPSIPDQLLMHTFAELPSFKVSGIALTENGAMQPAASVAGFYFANPETKYFSVDEVDEAQIADYARRRGLSPEQVKNILR